MAKRHTLLLACIISASTLTQVKAQTTLSGDHIITGKLNVGTTGALGGVEVTGQTGGSAAPGIKVTGDGGVVFAGTYGSGSLPATGTGARMMWYPKKAAFRVGEDTASDWSDSNIGVYSTVFGRGQAVGSYSIAAGQGSAFGDSSVAIGNNSATSYSDSFAFGGGWAGSQGTFAFGGCEVFGLGSVGFYGSTAGMYAFAGPLSTSAATLATAMSGGYAAGDYSVALGYTEAAAAYSVVVGRNANYEGDPYNWVSTDPLFVVGNGDLLTSSNAFVVRKNGNVEMTAKVTMPRQGDILMGEFGNSEQ